MMKFIKYKGIFFFIFLLVSTHVQGARTFTAKDCLDRNFSTTIQGSHSLFGLLKRQLDIKKNDCVVSLLETKYWFLKSSWEIDVCREPIHLKKEMFKNVDVYKKEFKCKRGEVQEFCQKTSELLGLFKDVGLIFAKGNRQSLQTSHGQTYCTYLLLKEYLKNDTIFVSGQRDVYIEGLEGAENAPIVPVKPWTVPEDKNIEKEAKTVEKEMEENIEEEIENIEKEIQEEMTSMATETELVKEKVEEKVEQGKEELNQDLEATGSF